MKIASLSKDSTAAVTLPIEVLKTVIKGKKRRSSVEIVHGKAKMSLLCMDGISEPRR